MQISLPISDELHALLVERAKKDQRSIAGEIRYLLAYAIEALDAKDALEKAKRGEK